MTSRPQKVPLTASPPEVVELYNNVEKALTTTTSDGRRVGSAQCGVYAFYDYDGEPIYIGQTSESLSTRVRRHITNQRTDAVAMFVLDPYEVASLALWPLWGLEQKSPGEIRETLDRAEYTVYREEVSGSVFGAVLNEGEIAEKELIGLPQAYHASVAPAGWEGRNEHPDVRLARRAQTVSLLTKVCSERKVSLGLRRTLVLQTRRLQHLAEERYDELTQSVGEGAAPEEAFKNGSEEDLVNDEFIEDETAD